MHVSFSDSRELLYMVSNGDLSAAMCKGSLTLLLNLQVTLQITQRPSEAETRACDQLVAAFNL